MIRACSAAEGELDVRQFLIVQYHTVARVDSLPHAIDALIPSLHGERHTCQWVVSVHGYTGTVGAHAWFGGQGRAASLP